MMYSKSQIIHLQSLDIIKKSILSGKIKLKADNPIIFVFGAKISDQKKIARKTFLEYSNKYLDKYIFLIAENFFNSYADKSRDLLSLENDLAIYTDCIIILLESDGTIAELGAFSNTNDLVSKMLVVNDQKFKTDDSFINLGPLRRLEKKSRFGKVIYVNMEKIIKSVGEIENKLNSSIRKNAKTILLTSIYEFIKKKNKKNRLLLIADLIFLFGPISKSDLHFILSYIYGNNKNIKINIDFDLSLLLALGFIKEKDNFMVKSFIKEFYFIDYGINILKVRSQIFNHYAKNFRERIQILTKIYDR